jgi:hypothetical protein
MTGGILIGMILAIGAYFITRKIVTKIRSREKRLRMPHLGGKKAESRKQSTKDRGKIAQAPNTAPSNPNCEYATVMLCQPATKEERPRTQRVAGYGMRVAGCVSRSEPSAVQPRDAQRVPRNFWPKTGRCKPESRSQLSKAISEIWSNDLTP